MRTSVSMEDATSEGNKDTYMCEKLTNNDPNPPNSFPFGTLDAAGYI